MPPLNEELLAADDCWRREESFGRSTSRFPHMPGGNPTLVYTWAAVTGFNELKDDR